MTLSFYRQLAATLTTDAVVVATVIQVRGSVPREVGTKMLIDTHGNLTGTIGGGAGEAKVIHHAKTVLITGEKQQIEIDLSGAPDRETQGVCGGWMSVWLERWQGEASRSLAQQILFHLETGQAVTLVTPLEQPRSPHLEFLCSPSPFSTSAAFIDVLQPPPTLLIVGAGHCGIQLAKVANLIGFEVVVQDDRPEWANAIHYPQAKVFTEAIAEVNMQLAQHRQLYAALLTRGYGYDLEALKLLLQRQIPCQYIGMIGSQKRVRRVLQAVEHAGIDRQRSPKIHAPIGLDIGALTPEEIAVSISAELILVRRGGTGRPLTRE